MSDPCPEFQCKETWWSLSCVLAYDLYHSFSFHVFSSHFKALRWCSPWADGIFQTNPVHLLKSFPPGCSEGCGQCTWQWETLKGLILWNFREVLLFDFMAFIFGGFGLYIYILYRSTLMKPCDPVQHGIVFTCAWMSFWFILNRV